MRQVEPVVGRLRHRLGKRFEREARVFRKDRTVIVYCATGGRSALAGKTMRDMGYRDVRNLRGFKDWAQAGTKVDKA